jgi:hypothetical protein
MKIYLNKIHNFLFSAKEIVKISGNLEFISEYTNNFLQQRLEVKE